MRRKSIKKLNYLLVILIISIITPTVAFAKEAPADTAETDTYKQQIIVDGKPADENMFIVADDTPVFTASENSGEHPVIVTNFAYNTSYIGKIEKNGVKFRARIPYWFANAFPEARFNVGKKSTKITVPVYELDGKKKLTTRSLKLATDSYLWLGNYEPDDYYNCPPWVKLLFDDAVVETIVRGDVSENGITYDYLITWVPVYKNAKAKKKSSPVITRVIEYCTPKKYTISAIENASNSHKGGFGLCSF